MIKTKGISDQTPPRPGTEKPHHLKVATIGIVSRDYNELRDFSKAFSDILKRLDDEGCDTVLFSLYSIVPRKSFRPFRSIRLRNIKAVLYEEGGRGQEDRQCVVFHRRANKWHRYPLPNYGFPRLRGSKKAKKKIVERFKRLGMPGRILGNCCAILCGEVNGVPYHQDGKVRDDFGLRKSLPRKVTVVLNPGHDRMTRHEMKKKRRYLSENNRLVVSVWNKGKKDGNGKTRDGTKPPWTVFHDGQEVTEKVVELQSPIKKVKIGIWGIGGA